MDFFIILPSNSNLDLYNDNTVSKYSVHFNRALPIDETYEVALAEIHFPYQVDEVIHTVGSDDDAFLLVDQSAKTMFKFSLDKDATWPNKLMLIEYINLVIEIIFLRNKKTGSSNPYLELGQNGGHVAYNAEESYIIKPTNEASIPYLKLGKSGELVVYNEESYTIKLTQSLLAKLMSKKLDYIYAYIDIIEPTFVGDAYVKLLRIVDVNCIDTVCSIIYQTPQYHNVIAKDPRTIEVNLRNSLGDLISLKNDGTTVVVLHARKRLM